MREGSYAEIKKGMQVVGREGETLGGVDQVIVDQGSDIFVGLAVRPDLFTHPMFVPGDSVDRLHQNTVYVDLTRGELKPYTTPEEKHHETQAAYAP